MTIMRNLSGTTANTLYWECLRNMLWSSCSGQNQEQILKSKAIKKNIKQVKLDIKKSEQRGEALLLLP